MQPADVVCFLTHPNNSVHPIATFQARFIPPYIIDAARVTHVAIYVGGDKIVHSLKSGGVKEDRLWDYAKTYGTVEVAVGRVPGMTVSVQQSICSHAQGYVGSAYNSNVIVTLIQQSITRYNMAPSIATAAATDEVICSGLVERCFQYGLNATPFLKGSPYPVLLPADIYMGPSLISVL